MNQDMTSMLLFTLTALIFTGAWVIGRMKRRDEQMETLLDRLGEVDFGGRLANDSLSIYQGAHKKMIDANTKIVERVPEQVRILAEEQRVAGERFTTFQASMDDLLEDLEGVSTHMATAESLSLVKGEVQSARSASSGEFTQLSALVADLQTRISTLDQNQAAIAGSLAELYRGMDAFQRQTLPLVEQMHRAIEREFS